MATIERDVVKETLTREEIASSPIHVSLDEYMAHYAADRYEWVEGVLIAMSPGSLKHNKLILYLCFLLDAFFELSEIGIVANSPFVMRLPVYPNRRREPDLMVVLNANMAQLTGTVMNGPADICIEVVSEESVERDHGTKFEEYQKGGVPEYWIIDGLRKEARFYRVNGEGVYIRQTEDADGNYRTPALPGFALHVPTLWLEKLPGPFESVASVRNMLKKD